MLNFVAMIETEMGLRIETITRPDYDSAVELASVWVRGSEMLHPWSSPLWRTFRMSWDSSTMTSPIFPRKWEPVTGNFSSWTATVFPP